MREAVIRKRELVLPGDSAIVEDAIEGNELLVTSYCIQDVPMMVAYTEDVFLDVYDRLELQKWDNRKLRRYVCAHTEYTKRNKAGRIVFARQSLEAFGLEGRVQQVLIDHSPARLIIVKKEDERKYSNIRALPKRSDSAYQGE